MEYAAVIIPTLNRKKHLQRCINSLLKNEIVKYTDLYISVDYPPDERYYNGYEEVKNYVKTIKGFQSLSIYYQSKNLGPGLNRKFLEEKVKNDNHDRYIFTDDDNEFSANFLEYMNWGLETFDMDDRVYAICSKADFNIEEQELNSDYLMLKSYNPYGAGHWLHKNKQCRDYLTQDNIDHIYISSSLQNKVYQHSPMLLKCLAEDLTGDVHAMRGRNGNITYIDIWENIYCIVNDKACIIPTIGKSRNWGNDGSGVHSTKNSQDVIEENELLDQYSIWPQTPRRCHYNIEEKCKVYRKNKFQISKKEKRKCKLKFLIYRIFGKKLLKKAVTLGRRLKRLERKEEEKIYYG